MNKTKEYSLKDASFGGEGHMTAYASTFDRIPDKAGDVVAKGAFAKSLNKHAETGTPVMFLWGHDTKDPFSNIGTVDSLIEDEHGLKAELTFDLANEKARYAYKLAKEGRVSKMSFAYDVKSQARVRLDDGTRANELRELDIKEVSLVPMPANDRAAVVSVKADEPEGDEGGESVVVATLEEMRAIRDAIAGQLEKLDALIDGTGGESAEGESAEEPEKANARDAKSAELLAKIERL